MAICESKCRYSRFRTVLFKFAHRGMIYRVNDEAVDILRVVQGSLNLEQLFQPGI